MTALLNFFVTVTFSLTLILMGGCNSGGIGEDAPAGVTPPISVNNFNGAFKINGEKYSLSGICKEDGEVTYKIGANPEATASCTNGVWEVSDIVPTLDDGDGGSTAVSDGDKVPVKVSFVGSGGTVNTVEGTFTIDRTAPSGGDVTVPESGTYPGGDLDFVVSFDENVFVDVTSGVPSLALTLDVSVGESSLAKYVSGSGTMELTFRYGIQSGDGDTDGVALAGSIELNSGTIKDQAGNDAGLSSLNVPALGGVKIATTLVTLSSVSAVGGFYGVDAVLELTVVFSEAVSVTGTPRLKLALAAGGMPDASYVSGDGSDTLVFSYTVSAGENDSDGIEVAEFVTSGGGVAGQYGFDVIVPSNLSLGQNVVVDTLAPSLEGLTDLSESPAVNVKNWSWGCTDASGPCSYRYAFRQGGGASHQFQDTDLYGTDVRSGTPSGDNGLWRLHIQAKDRADNESAVFSYGVNLDRVAPLLASKDIGVPGDETHSGDLDFSVEFSELVTVGGTPRLALTVGSDSKHADYIRGSGEKTLLFRYVIQGGDVDTDGIVLGPRIDLNGGSIVDSVQNVFDASATLQVPPLGAVLVEKERGVSISQTYHAVSEAGGSATYTVVLDSQPAGTVTVTPSESHTHATLEPTVLTFNADDWSRPKGVTVTVAAGADNRIDEVKDREVQIDHSVSGVGYTGGGAASVVVTLTDNDTRGITVQDTPFSISENGGERDYTVVLQSEPSRLVTVTPVPVPGRATVSPTSLVFNASNWDEPKTVTVTGVNDEIINDPARIARISHTITTGSDYRLVSSVAHVDVTLTDDDTGRVTLSRNSFTVDEASGSGDYTVVLTVKPSGPVTVTPVGVTGKAAVSAAITFDASNWSNPQTVTVRGVNDDIDNPSDRTATITHTITGGGYTSVSVGSVEVTLTDDDAKGVTISGTGALEVAEDSGTATYTVVLNSEPTGTVTVTPVSSLNTAATVGVALEFTTGNWNQAQDVTVTGVNDNIDNPSDVRTAVITHTVTGADYISGVTAGSVTVTVTDDDDGVKALIVVTGVTSIAEATGVTVTTYTIKLGTQPTATVRLTHSSGSAVVVTPPSLDFTTDNWANPQTLTVTAVNDDIDNPSDSRAATITHALTGTGSGYESGVTVADVTVMVTDDDTKGVTISKTTLDVGENEGTGTYTVKLNSKPTGGNVTVGVSSGTPVVATVNLASLTFTAIDWAKPQTVTVTGVNDNIDNKNPNRTSLITHTVSGTGTDYSSGVTVAGVMVTAIDDDDVPLTVAITGPAGPVLAADGPIALIITFSEAVSGFAKGDITVSSGRLGGAVGTGNNRIFTITLTPAARTRGTVTVDIDANKAISIIASNGNTKAGRYSVVVDNVLPAFVSENISVPGLGNHITGQHLDFIVTFTENMFVTGVPTLKMYLGTNPTADLFDSNKSSDYLSGSGGQSLTFRYTVLAGDVDSDGLWLSAKKIHMESGVTIKTLAGNALHAELRFTLSERKLTGVNVNSSALRDRVVSTLSDEQTPPLAFDPAQIKGLARWLDGADSKTLFSDLFCSTSLGAGESSLGCWSDKSGRGDHYLPVAGMEWPTLFDVLATEARRKSGELFVVTDIEGKVDILSFVYPYPLLEEETFRNPGEIREVVIYEEPLGESERAGLGKYLTCRWQLPSTTEDCL